MSSGGPVEPWRFMIGSNEVIVDYQMIPILAQYTWYVAKKASGIKYACTYTTIRGKPYILPMHRLLTGLSAKVVDHINGNGLDNRLSNLRTCTKSQNQHNGKRRCRGSSQYKGVRWKAANKKWQAAIKVKGKEIYLGIFEKEIDAAQAYDRASKEHHGEHGKRNFE